MVDLRKLDAPTHIEVNDRRAPQKTSIVCDEQNNKYGICITNYIYIYFKLMHRPGP